MRDRNNKDVVTNTPEDDAKRESPKEKVAMAQVAHRKAFGISSDLLQSTIKLSIEVIGGFNAALGVPRQRLRIVDLGGRTDNNINHRGQPYGMHVRVRRSRLTQSFRQRRTHHYDGWPRRSIDCLVESNRLAPHCPKVLR